MPDAHPQDQSAIRTDLGAIFVSLELSRSTWLITSLSPGAGEKLSKHSVSAGDVGGLLARFAQLQQKAAARMDRLFPIITIQEAGLDGFWIHRVLMGEGIESHVVDAASILTGAAIPIAPACRDVPNPSGPPSNVCWDADATGAGLATADAALAATP